MINDEKVYNLLKNFRDYLINNPHSELSEEIIYKELIYMGVYNSRNLSIEPLFKRWISFFDNLENLDVFVSEENKYYCQFENKNYFFSKYNNHLKVYVPLDCEHIEYGVKLIFEFLRLFNISHCSKVGKKIRNDNIVIRLTNKDDLNKLLHFIKNNNYIQEGLIKNNPFAFNEDGISMVYDGCLSYNSVIASYIFLYLKYKKKINELNNINVDDFYNFILSYYKNNFENELNKFNILNDFDSHFESIDHNYVFLNLKEVTLFIIKSKKKNFNIDDYIKCYESTLNLSFRNNNKENILNNRFIALDKECINSKFCNKIKVKSKAIFD